jgi:site-specific recombinase XerD
VTALRQRMLEDLQILHCSPTTIRIYPLPQISRPTWPQTVCALRFFYTHTLSQEIAIERIPFPPRERKLPMILSRQEVKALLEAPRTLRHRALLAVLYGLVP